MKKLTLVILLTFDLSSFATVEGDLNTSFTETGWFELGEENFDYYSSGFAFKRFSDFEYFHAYVRRQRDDVNNIHKLILESNSPFSPVMIDIANIDPSLAQQKIQIVADDNNGVFFAYTRLDCLVQDVSCEKDIVVIHYTSDGLLIDAEHVSFDIGSTFQRQNDILVDMIYIPETNRLALAVDVERNGSADTDFGIAVIDVNQFGELALSTNFATDGKATCFFDQSSSAGSLDTAKSITYIKSAPYNIIIGGSVFEGNGTNNGGWNLGFCEYNQMGMELRKWSTKPLSDLNQDQELLKDMHYLNDGNHSLIVGASVDGLGGLDFALTKYVWNTNINAWEIDQNFGDSSLFSYRDGWNTIGFEEFFVGKTNDTTQQLFLETDGSILLAGESNWVDINGDHRRIQMVKFNNQGEVDTSWGYSGTISHSLTNTLTDHINVLTESSNNNKIYMTGTHLNGERNTAFIASFINTDIIYKNGFD